jgi:DNA-binding response OmpR family regulator
MRVLIVEPHPDVRLLVELVVARLGHDAVTADADALDLEDVDAAVIEPGSGEGLDVAGRLRELGRPVVFASIFSRGEQTAALEPTAYLVKPFALSQLQEVLEAALPRRAA